MEWLKRPQATLGQLVWGGSMAKRWPLTGQTIFLKNFDLAVGGGRSTPMAMGWHRPPPFDRSVVAEATPMALGGGSATFNSQINFFKKKLFGLWGWLDHPKGHLKKNKNYFFKY
jgi:hypothetical protein